MADEEQTMEGQFQAKARPSDSEHNQDENPAGPSRTDTAPGDVAQGGSQSRTGAAPAGSPADEGSFGANARTAPAGAQAGPDQKEDEYTHYVHLADGRVIKHDLTEPLGPTFEEGEGDDVTRTQIIGVYPR